MKRMAWILTAVLALATTGAARSQDAPLETVLLVAAKNYENLLADLNHWGTVADNKKFLEGVGQIVGALMQITDFKVAHLEVVDQTRPLGMLVSTDGATLMPVFFLPVGPDLEAAATALTPLLGTVNKQDDGTYQFTRDAYTGYLKFENGWAFLSQNAAHLVKVPDPAKETAELLAAFDAVVQLNPPKVPEFLRDVGLDQLRIALESADVRAPGESDAAFAFREQMGKLRSKLLGRALGETEQITVGLVLDEKTSHGLAEITIKPIAGSATAAHFADLRDTKSQFGNVLNSGDKFNFLTSNLTGKMDEEITAYLASLVDGYRGTVQELVANSPDVKSDEERAAFKTLVDGICDVAKKTVEARDLDVAVRMNENLGKRNMLLAGRVVDGEALGKLFEQVAEYGKDDQGFAKVQLGVAEQAGVKIHSFALKKSPDSKTYEQMFGEAKFFVAATADRAFFGAGPQSLDMIKAAIEPQETPVEPLAFKARFTSLLRLMTGFVPEDQQLIVSVVAMQVQGGDTASLKAEVTPEGSLKIHGDADKGFLRVGAVLFNQQFGPLILKQFQGGGPGR